MSAAASLTTVAWKDLKVGKKLGQGAYGEVYLGKWQGREVAIKKLILQSLPVYLAKSFESETKIMAECGKCPNIVKLFGICQEEANYSMIMEYMEKGSLNEVLGDQDIELPWLLRFQIAIGIGKGLSYLHKKEILHRDLKSHNVLLDKALNAKITDFGLSKLKFESSSKSKQDGTKKSVGTLRWQAPELFKLSPVHTKATDIYAYAMVLWEIAARQIPYGLAEDSVIMACVKEGDREPFPEGCPPEYSKLISRAWDKEPEKRPGSHYIVSELEKLLSATTTPPQPSASISTQPAQTPTTQTLQDLILQLLALPEMKNYPSLSPLLQSYLDTLFEVDSQLLEGNDLKIYRFVQRMGNKMDPTVAALLEKALAPQGHSAPAPVIRPAPVLQVLSPVRAPALPTIPKIAFGKAQWEHFFGDVGVEPPLPSNIDQILNSPCPFWQGKKVHETHLLTLIPQTVNGQPFTLDSLGEMIQHPQQGTATMYQVYWDEIKKAYGSQPIGVSRWVLMTRDVIPGSRSKTFADQQKLVAKVGSGYVVPLLLDATAAILMAYFAKDERLFREEPLTYTRCQEKSGEDQTVCGGFGPAGLSVNYYYFVSDDNGVAVSRKF